jgi:hypothetical protein
MKEMHRLMVFVSAATISGSLLAAIPEKYQTIVDRNSFGLLPPAPPISETNATPPPSDLKITGFATIGGEKFVYVAIPPKGQKAQFQYLTLKQGQQEAGIEILEIMEQGEVRINNAGMPMLLSLLKNGFQGSGSSVNPSTAPLGTGGVPMSQPHTSAAIYNPAGMSSASPVAHATGGGSVAMNKPSGGNSSGQIASYGGNVVHSGNRASGVVYNSNPQPLAVSADGPDKGTHSFVNFPDTVEVRVPDPNASPVIAKDPWIRRQIPMPPLPGRAN